MESTLALTYNDLGAEVGLFLGWGRGNVPPYSDPAWSTTQKAGIDSAVKSGLRAFYWPTPLPNEAASYNWSFMKPMATLDLPSGKRITLLPDDAGGIEGEIVLASTVGLAWFPVQYVGMGMIYQQENQYPTTSGRPQLVCVEPIKGTTGTAGQRWQLRFWPMADTDYPIKVQYYVNPDYLSAAFPYALGGAVHAETILASCKAAAERDLDDMAQGPQWLNFQARLAASVNMDRRLKPQLHGYNEDRSDYRNRRWNPNWGRFWGENGITINGSSY